MFIDYKTVKDFIGWGKTENFVKELIKNYNIKTILEIGAGANPTINAEYIKANNLDYTISDIEDIELQKAEKVYNKMVVDFSADINIEQKYDLVFSRMVGEHISNGKLFHNNIFKILNKGGISFHCFSTLYALPFVLNRIMPENFSDRLLSAFAPRDKDKHGKFKAYYEWCRGPSNKMIKRYKSIGYEIIEYVGYFGHNYYKKIPVLNKIENAKAELLKRMRISYATAYTHIILQR
jgi:2-polyprenyl-3-methyl-5-hydroxy-6-metoxy-1,4-benzoquinol methylase